MLHVRHDVGEQQVERGVRVARPVGRRTAEPLAQGLGVGALQRRAAGQLLPVVDDRVDDAVAEAAQLLGRQAQGTVGHEAG